MSKICLKVIIAVFLFSVLWAPTAPAEEPAKASTDEVSTKEASIEDKKKAGPAAMVDGIPIPREEITMMTKRMEEYRKRRGEIVDDTVKETIKKEALENLIIGELLYKESVKEGIKVDEAQIDKELEEFKKRFVTDENYQAMLKKENVKEASIRLKILKGMAIKEFIETRIKPTVKVSEKEEKEYYDARQELFKKPDQIRASHILLMVNKDADEKTKEDVRKKIEKIQKKLYGGAEFHELAKLYSEGPSKVKGGDLNYFGRGKMVKPFEDAAFALKVGEVSDIVETQFGYHLIQVTDIKPAHIVPLKDVREDINTILKRENTKKAIEKFAEKLKANAKIEIFN